MIYIRNDLTQQTFALDSETAYKRHFARTWDIAIMKSMYDIFSDHDLLSEELRQDVCNSRAMYRMRKLKFSRTLFEANVVCDHSMDLQFLKNNQTVVTILFKESPGVGHSQFSFSNKEF